MFTFIHVKTHISDSDAHNTTDSTENATPTKSTESRSQIPRYKFKLNQDFNLNLYHEIPRNLSLLIWLILRMLQSQWKLSYTQIGKQHENVLGGYDY